MLAPVHRNWGNRVVREAETLAEAGYAVTALMRCEQGKAEKNGVTYIPAPRAGSRIGRFVKLPLVLWQALLIRADIYHLHNPDMIPLAFCLRLLGKRVIYDTHEDYSRRLMARQWLPKYLRRPLSWIISFAERSLSRLVQAAFVTQDNQLSTFSSRTHLLRNAPSIPEKMRQDVLVTAGQVQRDEQVFRLVYAGGLSPGRGLFVMVDALDRLNSEGVAVRLWLMGPELEPCLVRAEERRGWAYVDYLGMQQHESVFAHMVRSDAGLAVLSDVGDHATARPSKLFEYMAWGLPFIATNFPVWRAFVEGKGGLWVEPDSVEVLVKAIRRLHSEEGLRCTLSEEGKSFAKTFDWAEESRILLSVYRELR